MLHEPFVTAGRTGGLWQFPPNPPRQRRAPPTAEALAQIKERRDRLRDDGHRRSTQLVESLQRDGASRDDIFEQQAWDALAVRLQAQTNRCSRCWHDRQQRCICEAVGSLRLSLPVRVLVLMHHKEYYRASDDAKLLLMMLPPEQQSGSHVERALVRSLHSRTSSCAVLRQAALHLWPPRRPVRAHE